MSCEKLAAMKKSNILSVFFLSFLILLQSCSSTPVKPVRQVSNISTSDAEWNEVANNSVEQKINITELLQEKNPALLKQIKNDATDPLLLSFWGQSVNFDSGAKKIIVDLDILNDLHELFSVTTDGRVAHAGIIHTYGYLFSTIETPYGFKRARWTEPTLNKGFGLTTQAFSPTPSAGSLLSNVTFLAGKLAFRSPEKLQHLSALKNVSNELFTYDIKKLKRVRLEEKTTDIDLITTFVQFPYPTGDTNQYLLIYSTRNEITDEEKLITVFPVNEESFKKTTDPKNLGAEKLIQLKYNAFLPNQTFPIKGNRLIK